MLASPFTPADQPGRPIAQRAASAAPPVPAAASAGGGSVLAAAAAARVDDGAAWLDLEEPGWVELVDRDRLDLEDPGRCVLGQVHGEFFDVQLTLADAADYGFFPYEQLHPATSPDPHREPRIRAERDALTGAWHDLIARRRYTGAASTVQTSSAS